jgi:hypothetical protein
LLSERNHWAENRQCHCDAYDMLMVLVKVDWCHGEHLHIRADICPMPLFVRLFKIMLLKPSPLLTVNILSYHSSVIFTVQIAVAAHVVLTVFYGQSLTVAGG